MFEIFKKKLTIINEEGVEETYKIGRKETLTAETLAELSNNKGDDEDVEQPIG